MFDNFCHAKSRSSNFYQTESINLLDSFSQNNLQILSVVDALGSKHDSGSDDLSYSTAGESETRMQTGAWATSLRASMPAESTPESIGNCSCMESWSLPMHQIDDYHDNPPHSSKSCMYVQAMSSSPS
jgi:hypothetical protein